MESDAIQGLVELDRAQFVTAVLSNLGGHEWYSGQVMKFLFLLEKKGVYRPLFNFTPGPYGPVDYDILKTLEDLSEEGYILAKQDPAYGIMRYKVTRVGVRDGQKLMAWFTPKYREYVVQLAEWIRPLTFPVLVAALRRDYPEMVDR